MGAGEGERERERETKNLAKLCRSRHGQHAVHGLLTDCEQCREDLPLFCKMPQNTRGSDCTVSYQPGTRINEWVDLIMQYSMTAY